MYAGVTPEGNGPRFGKPGVFGSVLPIADTVVALTVGAKIDASERIIRTAIVVAKILFIDFDIFLLSPSFRSFQNFATIMSASSVFKSEWKAASDDTNRLINRLKLFIHL